MLVSLYWPCTRLEAKRHNEYLFHLSLRFHSSSSTLFPSRISVTPPLIMPSCLSRQQVINIPLFHMLLFFPSSLKSNTFTCIIPVTIIPIDINHVCTHLNRKIVLTSEFVVRHILPTVNFSQYVSF